MKNKNLPLEREGKNYKLTLWAISLLIAGSFLLFKNALASEITPQNLIKLTNQERIKNNLKPLKINNLLYKAAQNKANDLLEKQYFSHTSPQGKKFIEWIKEAGYNYIYAGENLAMDFVTAEGVIKAWMKSPSHRDNILSPYYDEIAIAVQKGNFQKRPTIIIAQIFGRQKHPSPAFYKNKLTKIQKNDILDNDTLKIIAFPSLLNYNNIDISYFNNENSLLKINKLSLEEKYPYKEKIAINKKQIPVVAGISNHRQNKTNFLLLIFSYLNIIFLTTFISVINIEKIFNKHILNSTYHQ